MNSGDYDSVYAIFANMEKEAPAYHLDLVTYDGVQMSAVLGLIDLFTIANRISAAANGPKIICHQRSPASITHGKAIDDPVDAILVPPNLSGKRGEEAPAFYDWLRDQHGAGSIICSVCAGAFWLARSGLLDGRPATTHWALEEEFRSAFPAVTMNAAELLVDHHDIVTAGGVMAWLDLGLYLVHRWQGPAVMTATARHLLVDPAGRAQKNYRSFRPPLDHGNAAILKVQHWLETNAVKDFTVPQLAAMVHMSDRSFLRHFKTATGHVPNRYVQLLRMEKARTLLETTRLAVNDIAWQSGYQDPAAFGRLFRDITGITPGEYRKRFGLISR